VSLKLSSTKPIVKKTKIRATVHVDIPRSTVVATGSVKVTITKGSSVVTRTAKLTRKGAAVITLPELKKKGKYSVRVTFSGSPNLLAARGHAKTVTAKVR
jgi:hypothetical protein